MVIDLTNNNLYHSIIRYLIVGLKMIDDRFVMEKAVLKIPTTNIFVIDK